MEYDLKKILELINAEKWNWAKTYVNIPHEYIVRGKCKMSDAEFLYIVHAQRDIGKKEVWGKYNFPYLYVDGYKYWTMGDTFENTIILNRQKVFSEFDLLDISESYYTINEAKQIYSYISRTFKDKVIFETGFGFGTFVKDSGIKPSNYYGVEPSKKAIDFFRTKNPGFYRRVSNKSFEESVDKWKGKDCVPIALFGSASYIMWQYLKLLADYNNDYFLMFYKPCYVPKGMEEMHHFEYSKEWLRKVFHKANIIEWKNYIIVSTKQINIKPTYIQNDIFQI